MPGGVIANNDISWPFTFHILVGMGQKHLKDFAVGMGEFQGIKLAGARTNQAGDIHAEMLAVIGHPNPGPFLGPASPGARIAFDAHLVQVPDTYIVIKEIGLESLQKLSLIHISEPTRRTPI